MSGDPALKPVRDYKVIGREFPMPGIPDQVTGRTVWIGDVRLPDMLHARMVRPATLGSTLVSVPELDRSRFPNARIVTKNNLVAVVSPDEWEAVKAARAVQAETRWSELGRTAGQRDDVTAAYRTNTEPMAAGDADAVGAALAGAARNAGGDPTRSSTSSMAPIGPYVAVAGRALRRYGHLSMRTRQTRRRCGRTSP